jgi:hypothetical protein
MIEATAPNNDMLSLIERESQASRHSQHELCQRSFEPDAVHRNSQNR